MREGSLHKDDRGASLLAVLVLMVVVSAIAVVITGITIANIQMKEVERGTKKNFYSADEIMDDLRAGVREKAEDALETAYADALQNYTRYSTNGTGVQEAFKQKYMNGLEACFVDAAKPQTDTTNDAGNVVYRVASYLPGQIKGCLKDSAEQACFSVPSADPKCEIDYGAGTFTLKGLRVTYKDAQDYETTITTDLVFSTPQMNFSGQRQIQEFMKYALIADDSIKIDASNVGIKGNVYAGANGIIANGGSATITGQTILTRGDIISQGGGNLTVGDAASSKMPSIWAENAGTDGKSSATLTLNGNIYVADDLALNARGSKVTLTGNYYGYNYQKNYGDTDTVSSDADFSSAIMINGKESTLNITGLQTLFLAGRTYISRGDANSANSDIPMGESLAVRTNQLAYYVPMQYVDTATNRFATSMNGVAYDGCAAYAQSINLDKNKLEGYLANQQVVPYYYTKGVNYYLNFKSQQAANDFYEAYYNANSTKSGSLASSYADQDALIISTEPGKALGMTMRGNLMYRTKPDELFSEKSVTIEPDKWKNQEGIYWDYCAKTAVQYKALQLSLKDEDTRATREQVRLVTTDSSGHEVIDKSVQPMFDELIDRSALQNVLNGHRDASGVTVYSPATDVYLIDAKSYMLPNTITQGIVVATGNLKVSGNFAGIVIAGGTVSFDSNATLSADKLLVMELFEEDQNRETPLFSQIFKSCGKKTSSQVTGQLDFDSYINYDEWKRN